MSARRAGGQGAGARRAGRGSRAGRGREARRAGRGSRAGGLRRPGVGARGLTCCRRGNNDVQQSGPLSVWVAEDGAGQGGAGRAGTRRGGVGAEGRRAGTGLGWVGPGRDGIIGIGPIFATPGLGPGRPGPLGPPGPPCAPNPHVTALSVLSFATCLQSAHTTAQCRQ